MKTLASPPRRNPSSSAAMAPSVVGMYHSVGLNVLLPEDKECEKETILRTKTARVLMALQTREMENEKENLIAVDCDSLPNKAMFPQQTRRPSSAIAVVPNFQKSMCWDQRALTRWTKMLPCEISDLVDPIRYFLMKALRQRARWFGRAAIRRCLNAVRLIQKTVREFLRRRDAIIRRIVKLWCAEEDQQRKVAKKLVNVRSSFSTPYRPTNDMQLSRYFSCWTTREVKMAVVRDVFHQRVCEFAHRYRVWRQTFRVREEGWIQAQRTRKEEICTRELVGQSFPPEAVQGLWTGKRFQDLSIGPKPPTFRFGLTTITVPQLVEHAFLCHQQRRHGQHSENSNQPVVHGTAENDFPNNIDDHQDLVHQWQQQMPNSGDLLTSRSGCSAYHPVRLADSFNVTSNLGRPKSAASSIVDDRSSSSAASSATAAQWRKLRDATVIRHMQMRGLDPYPNGFHAPERTPRSTNSARSFARLPSARSSVRSSFSAAGCHPDPAITTPRAQNNLDGEKKKERSKTTNSSSPSDHAFDEEEVEVAPPSPIAGIPVLQADGEIRPTDLPASALVPSPPANVRHSSKTGFLHRHVSSSESESSLNPIFPTALPLPTTNLSIAHEPTSHLLLTPSPPRVGKQVSLLPSPPKAAEPTYTNQQPHLDLGSDNCCPEGPTDHHQPSPIELTTEPNGHVSGANQQGSDHPACTVYQLQRRRSSCASSVTQEPAAAATTSFALAPLSPVRLRASSLGLAHSARAVGDGGRGDAMEKDAKGSLAKSIPGLSLLRSRPQVSKTGASSPSKQGIKKAFGCLSSRHEKNVSASKLNKSFTPLAQLKLNSSNVGNATPGKTSARKANERSVGLTTPRYLKATESSVAFRWTTGK